MGRGFHEHSDDVEFESYHPGCMGGIFNVLDYHHWHKMFPHRNYIKGRHARCGANPQTISMEREHGETRGLLDSEEDQIQVQQQTRKTGLTNKSSGKGSTQGLTGKDKPKEENHKHWNLGFSARPQSQQSDTNQTTRKQQVTRSKRRGARTLVNQKLKKEVSDNQDGADVLEMFKLSKDLFLDILQDPEVGISQHFPGKQTSKTVKFTKSVSFPMSNSSRTRYLKPSTLEHKQQEVWSFKKGQKSKAGGAQLSKSRALRTDAEETSSSSSQGSDPQRWNNLFMNRLKYIKQRIKQALKERRKSSSSSSSHTMVPKISLEKRTMDEVASNKFKSSVETDASDHVDTRNGRLNKIRRTKSINESLDRYTQLFEHSVNKKADLHHSKSLKLANEDKISSITHAPKFFRRISSLSDIESFYSLVNEVSRDALSSEMPNRTSILNHEANKESDSHNELESISFPEDVDKFEPVEAVLKTELQENLIEGNNREPKPCDIDEQMVELPTEKTSPYQEQESASEDAGLNHPNLPKAEADQSFLIFESDKKAYPCYNYVRDILHLSGFMQNEQHLQTWYSSDQPLNPSLFKELETLLHPDDQLDSSIEEVGSYCDHHQLVFDLVNETLLEISENSPIYFPKSFRSINCRSTQMLKVKNIVEEVWTKVSRTLNSQPEFHQSLDGIVARDLAKDGWMNLQGEAEIVALELEDLVFDELLDEFLCL